VTEPAGRAEWLLRLRERMAAEEAVLFVDRRWGEIEATHWRFAKRFLAVLPSDGRILDAACGTEKYFEEMQKAL
jgi:hypothetical protein